jgi:hypothetical protein
MPINATPRFEPSDATRITHDLFGLGAVARSLPSERVQNFAMTEYLFMAPMRIERLGAPEGREP